MELGGGAGAAEKRFRGLGTPIPLGSQGPGSVNTRIPPASGITPMGSRTPGALTARSPGSGSLVVGEGGGGGGGGGGTLTPAGTPRGRRTPSGRVPPRPADLKFQLILIGNRGVGKTSLMERFTDDAYSDACKSTVGVDFKIKTIELGGKKIRLQIWDTAGQERFNSITSAYYRGARGILLVYDLTRRDSFLDLHKWMSMVDKYASEDVDLLLVGNKLDREAEREVTREEGLKFAQRFSGMRFCEASARENRNVEDIFLRLVEDIVRRMPMEPLSRDLMTGVLALPSEPPAPEPPTRRCC
ncbi:ras-related protein Rab-12 [Lampetra fluviatilis]